MKEEFKTIEDVKRYLDERGINPSYQRLKIYEWLLNNRTHPTVESIYKALLKEIPTLSKTTIYNTLNLFQQHGLVNALTIEENEVRYDINTEPHSHFKCKVCGKVIDLPIPRKLDVKELIPEEVKSNKIEEIHIYYKGKCADCA